MASLTPQQLTEVLNWRYAVKKFDAERTIPDETWSAIERSLVLTPSSYGLQPWRFIVVTDPDVKAKLPELSWNQKQPMDCSHMVLLAARESMNADYVDGYMHSVVETRELAPGAMDGYRRQLVKTIDNMEEHLGWNAKQVYIALGQLMLSAALLGVDACPMEGINAHAYDELLGLGGSGYTCVVGCAMGYRHADDGQATAKKVRFELEDIIQRV